MAARPQIDDDPLLPAYASVRALSDALAAPLSDADATIQPMDDASPAKWHLAHTSWFFETFVLRQTAGDRSFDPRFAFLFNSYYEAEGPRHARPRRGMLSRPSLDEVRAYRTDVDARMAAAIPALDEDARALVTLGLNHEQQHQELLLMDIKAALHANPLRPALWPDRAAAPAADPGPAGWREGRSGIAQVGREGPAFAFDNEGPRHPVLLHRHAIADRLVTNGEWQAFIAAGGYRDPGLWLADGWAWVQAEGIAAPLYWEEGEDGWRVFGLDGLRPVDPHAPVCHVNYYEADAFARWSGARLPTEAEWEAMAAGEDAAGGIQLDAAGPVAPRGGGALFGDVWQWTMSGYLPYPGFRAAPGAVGEYNGKFMCGQFVLKGASCATPRGHARASYRNFFYPHQRWQFAGVRLARDL